MPISFVAAGAFASGTGTITPSIPAGVVADDLLLLFRETAQSYLPPPAGWSDAPFVPPVAGNAGATGAGGNTLTFSGASWTANQWVGTYLNYDAPVGGSGGTASLITANTSNTVTIAGTFSLNNAGGTASITGVGQGTTSAATGVSLSVSWKWATGSDTAPSITGVNHVTAQILAYRGVPTGVAFPQITPAFATFGVASTTVYFPGIATTVANSWIVIACAVDNDGNSTALVNLPTHANATGGAIRVNQSVNTAAGGGLFVADYQQALIGNGGLFSSTGVSTTRVAITLAFSAQGPAAAFVSTASASASAVAIALTEAPWVGSAAATSSRTAALTTTIQLAAAVSASVSTDPAVLVLGGAKFAAQVYSSTIAYIAVGPIFNSGALAVAGIGSTISQQAITASTPTGGFRFNSGVSVETTTDGIVWSTGSGFFGSSPRGIAVGPAYSLFWNNTTSFERFNSVTLARLSTGGNPLSVAWTHAGYSSYYGSYITGQGTIWFKSTDSITWVRQTDLAVGVPAGRTMLYTPTGQIMYRDAAGSGTVTSPDGVTWTSNTGAGLVTSALDIVVHNGQFVAVAQAATQATKVMTSADGVTWTTYPAAFSFTTSKVASNGRYLLALGTTGAGRRLFTSTDGASWQVWPIPTAFNSLGTLDGVYAFQDKFILEGYDVVGQTMLLGLQNAPALAEPAASGNLYTVSSVLLSQQRSLLQTRYLSTNASNTNRVFLQTARSPITGTLISVRDTGISRSTDAGVTYTALGSATTTPSDIAVSDSGTFVVTSNDGGIFTSTTDGATWVTVMANTTSGSVAPTTVVFFAGQFIRRYGSPTDGLLWYSTDGVTWTSSVTSPQQFASRLLIANGTLVMCGSSGTAVSLDGIAWTTYPVNYSSTGSVEGFLGRYWFAVNVTAGMDSGYQVISYSLDLSSMTSSTIVGPATIQREPQLFEVDGVLMLTGGGGPWYTEDGTNWTLVTASTNPVPNFGTRVPRAPYLPNGGRIVGQYLISRSGAKATGALRELVSTTALAGFARATAYAVVPAFAVPARFVADSFAFQAVAVGATGTAPAAAYGNGIYVVMDEVTDRLYYSYDGDTWNFVQSSGIAAERVLFTGSRFYRLPTTPGTAFATSTDGFTWDQVTLGGTYDVREVAYGNGVYLATDNAGTTWTATDGKTFTARTDLAGYTLAGIAFAFGQFYLAAPSQTDLTTTSDGISWGATIPLLTSVGNVSFAGGKLFAHAASRKSLKYSTDGTTWSAEYTPSVLGTSGVMNPKITYSNGHYFCYGDIGAGDQMLASRNGVDWWVRDLPGGYQSLQVVHGAGGRVLTDGVGSGGRTFSVSAKMAQASASMVAAGAVLAATRASSASVSGTLSTQIRLAASCISAPVVSADLTITVATVALAGAVVSEAGAAAAMTSGIRLAGAVSASVQRGAALSIVPSSLFASAQGLAAAGGTLLVQGRFASVRSCAASAAASLSTGVRVVGIAECDAASRAALTTLPWLMDRSPRRVVEGAGLLTVVAPVLARRHCAEAARGRVRVLAAQTTAVVLADDGDRLVKSEII